MNRILLSAFALASFVASAAAIAEPTTYLVDPTHTSVTAESRHFGTSTVRSHFGVKGGSVTIDPVARTGTATITIDMASVQTGVPKLDTHLKSDAFFDAAGYPDGTFTATKFVFDGEKVTQLIGDLTLRGKTGPVTLTATNYNCYLSPNFKKQVCGGDFETSIKRTDWEIKYLVPFVSDETKLRIQIEAVKQ
jgi:polyisoprenoid-binding protein YceI